MVIAVGIERVRSRRLAAVRRELFPREVAVAWRAAVDLVWEFIRSQPGLWRDGHNVFVYHHPTDPDGPMVCEFGVEVTRTFDRTGQVYTTATPAGEAVVAVYRGPYRGLN